MTLILTLFDQTSYINWPQSNLGWAGLFLLSAILIWAQWRWRRFRTPNWGGIQWGELIGLLILVPITTLIFGLRLPAWGILPQPGIPEIPQGPAVMVLSALPWMLAAGFLGTLPAGFLAAVSGLVLALFETHSPFTPLEWAAIGTLGGVFFQQSYRTSFFKLARQPLFTLILMPGVYGLLFLIDRLFESFGTLAVRLDFGQAQMWLEIAAFAIQVLVAGILVQGLVFIWSSAWGSQKESVPSPIESSLESRFTYSIGALVFLLFLAMMIGDWIVAGNAARQMLHSRMAANAQLASESVPLFLEAGQNLISQYANDPLTTLSVDEQTQILSSDMRRVPFFRQLFVFDTQGQPVSGYPETNYAALNITPTELTGIDLALQGVLAQIYVIPPIAGGDAAQVSFLSAILDEQGVPQGVLMGRTDLMSNPFTQPVLRSLSSLADIQGQGMLIDGQGRVVYHPDSSRVMSRYVGQLQTEPLFYDDTAPSGTRQLIFTRPVVGSDWFVALTVPAQQVQNLALQIAMPLMIVLFIVVILLFSLLRVVMRVVVGSLQNFATEAAHIAQGHLDRALQVERADEVGQLSRAFERMRISLKSRLDELNRLLSASLGVARSLEMETMLNPILESASPNDKRVSRIILASSAIFDDQKGQHPTRFGHGEAILSDNNQIDNALLKLLTRQDKLILSGRDRIRQVLGLGIGREAPQALFSMSLRHENRFYGIFWVADIAINAFTDGDIRFLTTLGGQAALAVANASLFMSAELERQRLSAILSSTPDPVLVTDQSNRLMLANPSARDTLGITGKSVEKQPIDQVIKQPELLNLLQNSTAERTSAEIQLPDGRYYFAAISSVMADGQMRGRVCVLRDVTHFKELAALKTEFVATVSHDLRSPLTLLKGYATMMPMIGTLTAQQTEYVRKIIFGVEKMTRLVNNLLDLGRIEAGIGLDLEMVPVVDIVEQVVNELKLHADQKQISIQVEVPSQTTPLLEADHALLQQALQNLVDNAIKYSQPGGKVLVRVQVRPTGMFFEIQDSGIGIAAVDQPHLFEKFFRAKNRDVDKRSGTGLGLAIVKSIAEWHGGRVWVTSQLGKGSTFSMELPFHPSQITDREA